MKYKKLCLINLLSFCFDFFSIFIISLIFHGAKNIVFNLNGDFVNINAVKLYSYIALFILIIIQISIVIRLVLKKKIEFKSKWNLIFEIIIIILIAKLASWMMFSVFMITPVVITPIEY